MFSELNSLLIMWEKHFLHNFEANEKKLDYKLIYSASSWLTSASFNLTFGAC